MSSSLNYHDLLVALGGIPVADGRIVLSDCAGEIVKCGPNVKIWQKGDRVISCCYPHWRSGPPNPKLLSFIGDNEDGYATEYIAISETSITRAPSNWTIRISNIAMCSLNSVACSDRERKSEANQTVLTLGSGGVSLFVIQFAKSMGAKVISTSSSEVKRNKLKEMGADEVINYNEHKQWGKEVLRLTDGEGVDHVIEVGGGMTLRIN